MLIRAYAGEFAYRHKGTYNRITLRIEPRKSARRSDSSLMAGQ